MEVLGNVMKEVVSKETAITLVDVLTIGAAVITAIIAFFSYREAKKATKEAEDSAREANRYSKEANQSAKQANDYSQEANLYSKEANGIMDKANVIAKNYQYVTLLLDLYSKRYISKEVFFLNSPKLFQKHIESLSEEVRTSNKKFQNGKIEVIFDYIINHETKEIYEFKVNQKKKAVIDNVYKILDDLELLLPFIEESNQEEGLKIQDFIQQAKQKKGNVQLINKFGQHSFKHPEAHVLKASETFRSNCHSCDLLPEGTDFAWETTEIVSKDMRHLYCYDFSRKLDDFSQAVNQIKNHYGNYYVYQDLQIAYQNSLFFKEGVRANGE